MKINAYEARMLDAVLESFGDQHTLTLVQLSQIFDGDDALADAIISLLVQSALVTLNDDLLIRQPQAVPFLDKGGFLAQYERAEQAGPSEQVTATQIDEREDTIRLPTLKNHRLKTNQQILLVVCLALLAVIVYLLFKKH